MLLYNVSLIWFWLLVELGVTIPLCALLLVVGCCISVYVTVNKDRM